MLLLVNRLLAQIHLVAAGGPSKEAKLEGAWPKLDQNPEVMCRLCVDYYFPGLNGYDSQIQKLAHV